MVARDRSAFAVGINCYVPGMGYAADIVHGQPAAFSLGSPAAVSANNIAAAIAANAVATTAVAISWTMDSKYGRTLRLTPSGNPGNSASIDIFGFDYLGQPMVERFTGASGSTSILYGKKAFYRVTNSKIVTAASNAVTWAVGTGYRLGLPYKGDLHWVQENGVLVPIYKRDVDFFVDRSAVLAAAGGSKWVRPAFPGFVKTLIGTPDGGGSTNDPVITVKLATVAITGLTVTVDTSDTAGTTVTGAPTTPGYSANNRFLAGDKIEIAGASAASALGDRLGLTLTPTQFTLPDLTDPQTNVTGDPRGTYEPLTVPGGFEIIVGLSGDPTVNASGNGGLHGLRHFTS